MNRTPQHTDWNRFWDRTQSKRFGKVSWSKRRILQVLDPYLFAGKSVLDAGCGSGFFSRHFCEKGLNTCALDFSAAALATTKENTDNRVVLCQADMLHDNLQEKLKKCFDLVFSDGIFEHFCGPDQDVMMQNLIAVTKREGLIVTFVPNRWSPWELIRPIYMPGIDETPLIMKELLNLNHRNGLRVIADGGVNTLPFKFSPEGKIARYFGMLLFTIAQPIMSSDNKR
jgi:SAM-dependent methyltransferase